MPPIRPKIRPTAPRNELEWARLAQDYATIAASYRRDHASLSVEITALRQDVVAGFADINRRLNNTARAIVSDASRAYTIPVSDAGTVDLDALQEKLDALTEAKRAAEIISEHAAKVKSESEARLRRLVAVFTIAVAISSIFGAWWGLVKH